MSGRIIKIAATLAIVLAIVVGVSCSNDDALSVTSLDVTSGPRSGYQNVTIHGTGFSEATSVRFGSNEAVSFTVADPTQIVVKSPLGELGQVVDVTVATDKDSSTLPDAYTYWDYDLKLAKGSAAATFTLDQIKALPSVTGYWGAHKDPVPHIIDQYRGVPLLTLLEEVGGWKAGEEITVTAADNFVTVYTPQMLEQMADGTYPMWNVNGTEIITDDRSARLIVAYEIDTKGDGSSWEPLPAGTGPLRMVAITAENDRVSTGKFNPFLAMSVEVAK